MGDILGGMTLAELLCQSKEERLAEVGNGPSCPYCQRPRVTRSTYIRCNLCGMNWFQGQDIFQHPHIKVIKSSSPEMDTGVVPAK
jgi:ribosomal protein L37AE/L43A